MIARLGIALMFFALVLTAASSFAAPVVRSLAGLS